jgi:hypothetical protein
MTSLWVRFEFVQTFLRSNASCFLPITHFSTSSWYCFAVTSGKRGIIPVHKRRILVQLDSIIEIRRLLHISFIRNWQILSGSERAIRVHSRQNTTSQVVFELALVMAFPLFWFYLEKLLMPLFSMRVRVIWVHLSTTAGLLLSSFVHNCRPASFTLLSILFGDSGLFLQLGCNLWLPSIILRSHYAWCADTAQFVVCTNYLCSCFHRCRSTTMKKQNTELERYHQVEVLAKMTLMISSMLCKHGLPLFIYSLSRTR